MARLPKSPDLHLIKGSYRADRHARKKLALPPPGDGLSSRDLPKYLSKEARQIWRKNLPNLYWLHRIDAAIFGVWCTLQAQFEKAPHEMQSARLSLLRQIGNDLGVSRAGRQRLGLPADPPAPSAKSEYFE